MGIAVALIAILGYGLHIDRLTKWPLESSLLFVCTSLVCLLYGAGLLGCLQITTQILLGIGVLFFLANVFSQWKKEAIARSMSPGVWFFLMSIIGLWIFTRSEYYSNFEFVDDFSHWGRISKVIAGNDRLIIPADPVWFQDYPPGMALFDYLFFQFSGFRENNAMFAHGVFIFAALTQIFSKISRPVNRYVSFGISIFIYTLIYFFGSGLHTLSVDLIVGVVFGIGVLGYLADSQNGRLIAVIRLIPLVMVLPLIKQIGILFSFVIGSVVICDLLFASIGGKEKSKLILAALLLITTSLLTYISWGEHVMNTGVQKTFNSAISVREVAKAFIPALATERQKTTINNFIHRVFLPRSESKINRGYYWLVICLSFVWLIWHMEKEYRSWVGFAPFAVIFTGFFTYLFILLVLYMFLFGAYEGPRLASFDRYVNTYLVGMLIILFGVSLSQYFKEKQNRVTTIALITVCLLVMLPNLKAERRDIANTVGGRQDQHVEKLVKYWEVIKNNTASNSRIYFVWQDSNGTENTIFNYGIIPRESNRGCWSVGDPYAEGDVWTCKKSISDFARELKEYDYLLVAHADSQFGKKFMRLFGSDNIPDGSLFRIMKGAELVRLRKI